MRAGSFLRRCGRAIARVLDALPPDPHAPRLHRNLTFLPVSEDQMRRLLLEHRATELADWADARITELLEANNREVERRRQAEARVAELLTELAAARAPIPMLLTCPICGEPHIDAIELDKGWTNPPHKSHLCHGCGAIWRPADVATEGVLAIETRGEKDTWP